MRPLPALAVLALLAAAAPAAAHGIDQARELEVYLLEDEASDVVMAYGYDLHQVFLGAAHDPAAPGAAGDGLYFRFSLYGEYPTAAPGAAWRVELRFEVDGKQVSRHLETRDGTRFTTDFDALVAEVEGELVTVERAFVHLGKAGLPADGTLTGLRMASLVDGDVRDVAPGGIPVPGTGGAVAGPDEGRVHNATARLPDVAGYADVVATPGPDGWTLRVQSLLRQGEQHATLRLPQAEGWNLTADGPLSAVLPKGGSATFSFRAEAAPGAAPATLEVVTDVGGRIPVTLAAEGGAQVVRAKGQEALRAPLVPAQASPAAGVALLLAALGAAALARR